MTEGRLRDAVRSLDGSLDDVRREQAWRRIERAVTSQPPAVPARRWRFVGIAALAGGLAVAAVLYLRTRSGDEAPLATARTELAAAAGQQTIYERGGIVLTLVGPGAATVTEGDPRGLHVRVERGTLVADRAARIGRGAAAPSLVLEAGGSTTTSRDARIAVRVQPGLVVFGAGEQARAIIERHDVTPPPPAPAPVPTPAPTVPTTDAQPKPRVPPASVATETAPNVEPPPIVITLDARELYARAEAALRVKDPISARQLLQRILVEYPEDPLVDAARYDLALIAIGNGNSEAALVYTRQIIDAGRDPALRAAARKLHDRIKEPKQR